MSRSERKLWHALRRSYGVTKARGFSTPRVHVLVNAKEPLTYQLRIPKSNTRAYDYEVIVKGKRGGM